MTQSIGIASFLLLGLFLRPTQKGYRTKPNEVKRLPIGLELLVRHGETPSIRHAYKLINILCFIYTYIA